MTKLILAKMFMIDRLLIVFIAEDISTILVAYDWFCEDILSGLQAVAICVQSHNSKKQQEIEALISGPIVSVRGGDKGSLSPPNANHTGSVANRKSTKYKELHDEAI